MADCHLWRGPEGDDKSQVDRMANHSIQRGCLECRRSWPAIRSIGPHLSQSKELEMIYEKRGQQENAPTNPEQRLDHRRGGRAGQIPHYKWNWFPLRQNQPEGRARRDYVCRALDRRGYKTGPHTLEALTRHHAVLHGKYTKHSQINRYRCCKLGL